jgi:hypothetical protein
VTELTASIDYRIEYLEAGLAAGQLGAGAAWQTAFEAARDGWDLARAQTQGTRRLAPAC